MFEHEPSPERIALFKVTCPTHGILADKMFLGAIAGIVEAHREFMKCDAVIKPAFVGYVTSSPRPEVS